MNGESGVVDVEWLKLSRQQEYGGWMFMGTVEDFEAEKQ